MAKSKKLISDLDWQTSSTMRWLEGQEVIAYLDWDEHRYYLWFEPSSNFYDWVEECAGELDDCMARVENEIDKIGVQEFCDLESVNQFCKWYCGSDDPYDCAEFYEDEWGNICGA